MQVYRTFFRILRRHKGYVVLYLCIFLGVALIISSNHASESGRKTWEEVSYPFAVFDEDQTEMSRGLVSCLEEGNEKIEAEDDREMVTDELYERNLVCVMRIPKGFGASLLTGKEGREVEITAVQGTAYDETFRMLTADYIQLIRYYLSDGCQTAEAVEKAITEVRAKTPVSVGEESSVLHGRAYYFFLYLPFILISICVAALGPTIMAFQRQEIRYRRAWTMSYIFSSGTCWHGRGGLVFSGNSLFTEYGQFPSRCTGDHFPCGADIAWAFGACHGG